MIKLGREIKKARDMKGLTLEQLSQNIFNDKQNIGFLSAIENGIKPQASHEKVNKVLAYFGIDSAKLLEEINNTTSNYNLIYPDDVKTTKTYNNLLKTDPKNPYLNNKLTCQLLLKKQSLELITNGLNVYRCTGKIPNNIAGNQLEILKELIELEILKNEY